jgi:CD164 antigen
LLYSSIFVYVTLDTSFSTVAWNGTTTKIPPTTATEISPSRETTTYMTPTGNGSVTDEPSSVSSTTAAAYTSSTVNDSTSESVTTGTTPITTVKPNSNCPGFNAGSFFGGILLAVGLIVIGYIAFRWYKSRQGPSYHQF